MDGSELRYVQEAFATNWLSTVGPNLGALEQRFSEMVELPAVALSSGTAGIHLALKLLGVKDGDEVVTPTLTFAASCNPVLYERAVPIFMDSERNTWNLDPNLLADFLKKRARTNKLPKAVTVVHLFGQSADLDSILTVCRQYGLPLLEDAAESLGATYKDRWPGTFGDVGVFSFNGNKIITGTTGGMIVSSRQDLMDKAKSWSTQSRDPDPDGLNNYCHSDLGYNYRMSNVVAGIVRGQLEVLDERVSQRRAVFSRYAEAFKNLPGVTLQPEAAFGGGKPETGDRISASCLPPPTSLHTRWLSCSLIDEKEFGLSASDLIRFLDTANVEARPVWKPMHTQKLYERCESVGGEVAEDLNRRGICLPSSSSLNVDDQQFVIDRIHEAHSLEVNSSNSL